MAAQTCLSNADVMTGVALMFFCQRLGGSIFISIAQTIFTQSLVKKLGPIVAGHGVSISALTNTGATDLRGIVPPQYLEIVLVAYNAALQDVFKLSVALAAAGIVAGVTMEWKSVKGKKQGGEPEKSEDAVTTETESPSRTGTAVAEEPAGTAVDGDANVAADETSIEKSAVETRVNGEGGTKV